MIRTAQKLFMKQTPVHEIHNDEVLKLIPRTSKRVIEVGCSSGALAREFKRKNPDANWVGIEIDQDYAELAKRYCDTTVVKNLDECDQGFYESYRDRDCWIFADVLEHFKDPWSVVRSIRNVIPENGSLIACIPNAQNWYVIAKLVIGDFRYEDMGLFDRTHLRWFTRQTIYELFESQGFQVAEGCARTTDVPHQEILELIGKIAGQCGSDPSVSKADATPLQYVVRAIPT